MLNAIFDRLAYISVMIYLVYILAEGWSRLPLVF